MVNEIGVNSILQIAALVVWEEDVDGLGTWVAAIRSEFRAGFRGDAVVD